MKKQPSNTESFLQLINKCIVESLALYKDVFGPIAKVASQSGLCKVRLHMPKHTTFYLHCYGWSQNFFGGTLESALKSTEKAPTKITSHHQDHICKELANQQHKQFLCIESWYERSLTSADNEKILPANDENHTK